jgi:hypothetical protein
MRDSNQIIHLDCREKKVEEIKCWMGEFVDSESKGLEELRSLPGGYESETTFNFRFDGDKEMVPGRNVAVENCSE